jgi:hypothetical protein
LSKVLHGKHVYETPYIDYPTAQQLADMDAKRTPQERADIAAARADLDAKLAAILAAKKRTNNRGGISSPV